MQFSQTKNNGLFGELGDVEDIIEDILIISYLNGTNDGNSMMKSEVDADAREMRDSVYRKTKGQDFKERIAEYKKNDDIESIMRVAETESHRIYNEAVSQVGRRTNATMKTWNTMLDDRVRSTHDYLEHMTVPFNEDFYTFDGDHAFAPGGFEKAENNCGCRCYIQISN